MRRCVPCAVRIRVMPPVQASSASVVLALIASCGAGASGRAKSAGVAMRAWRPGPAETRCDDAAEVADLEGSSVDTRALCGRGERRACVALVEHGRPFASSDFDLARQILANRCGAGRASERQRPGDPDAAREATCSCGAYGTVLTYHPSTEVDGIVLLDDACTRGLLDACDQAALIAELCVYERRAMCDDLASQGRLRKPHDDEYARPTVLPADLRGCWSEPGGTVVCFENDRVSVKPLQGPWDQVPVSWRGYDGVGVYWPSHERRRLERDRGVVTYGDARLARAPADAARQAGALPYAKEVCERARRCLDALRPPPPPPSRADGEGEGEKEMPLPDVPDLEGFPTNLVGCERIARAARARGSSCAAR